MRGNDSMARGRFHLRALRSRLDEKPKQMLAERRIMGYFDSEYHKDATMAKDGNKETNAKPERRRATKRDLAKRDLRLIEKLAAGATIEEIAANEGISPQWARARKSAILARRAIDPPHEFIQLQIRRLSEAMLVAYADMTDGNLKAVDYVIKVARELDRYHGFGLDRSAPRFAAPAPIAPPPLALPELPAALPAPEVEATTAASEPRHPMPGDGAAVAE